MITIFKGITTEDALLKLEADGEKYTGLYVDMSNKDERKFAKGQAELINGLLKKIDRARIDVSKDFKLSVESEANHIKDRLVAANKPFTELIDKWNAERKAILDNEKRIEQEKEAAIQFIKDFDEAITLNKVFDFELKEKRERELKEIERIKEEAANKARIDADLAAKEKIEEANRKELMAKLRAEKAEEDRLEAIKQAEIDKQEAIEKEQLKAKEVADKLESDRLASIAKEEAEQRKADAIEAAKKADINHRREVNNETLTSFIDNGIDEIQAKAIIKLIAGNRIDNVSINY